MKQQSGKLMINCPENPKHKQHFEMDGYKDCGWINGGHESLLSKIKECREHMCEHIEYDNSPTLWKGSDVIYICDRNKYFYHEDSSD